MTKSRKATIKERNALFAILSNQLKRGQSVALYAGHRFEVAAREFDADGLVVLNEVSGAAGVVLQVVRNF